MRQPNLEKLYQDVPEAQKAMLRRFRAEHDYQTLRVAGADWRYITCGQGATTVVLLPGGFMRADMWMHLIKALENDYKIIAPDAYALQGTFDIKAACDALATILDTQDVQQAIVVGLSAGGGWAQYMIQYYPQRVASVVLSHCGTINRARSEMRRGRLWLSLLRLLPSGLLRRMLLKRVGGAYPEHAPWLDYARAFVQETTLQIERDMLIGFFEGGIQALSAYPYQAQVFENWPGEALLLTSVDDNVTHQHLPALKKMFPHAQVTSLPEGGHHTLLLFPDAYVAAVRDFIASLKAVPEV
jgi:pimeloyl-ACP methyl ester carboxylesterase